VIILLIMSDTELFLRIFFAIALGVLLVVAIGLLICFWAYYHLGGGSRLGARHRQELVERAQARRTLIESDESQSTDSE
jgi:hypothetical protein